MLHYNLIPFTKILSDLGILANVCVTFYDTNFNETSLMSRETANQFCPVVKKFCYKHCALSDETAFKRMQTEKQCFYYHCHFGFIEICLNIVSNNETLGYLLIGPFRDPAQETQDLQKILDFSTQHGLDYKEMKRYYYETALFQESKYVALQGLINVLFDYASIKNFISKKNNSFSQAIEPYLLSHLADDLSIEFLCDYFHVSKKMLYSIFKTETDSTPKHYINEQRIQKATSLILRSEMSLPDISASVGINDYNYFIKLFKKHTGHTPMHFRKNSPYD